MRRRTVLLWSCRLLPLLAAQHVAGQLDLGVIEGVVADEGGAPIAGAEIIVRDTMHQKTFSTISGENGRYEVADLVQGRYTLRARAKGYCDIWISTIVVHRGEAVVQSVTLRRSEGPT